METWLAALRVRLPRHAALVDALLAICRDDPRIRVLQLQASIARGGGDEMSDLDLVIGVRDADWETVADALPARLGEIADVVDQVSHSIPEWGTHPHRRIFVQYGDGRQIDLVVQPASAVSGLVPGAIVLHDPDRRLATPRLPRLASATADDVREWEVIGWELLANVAKYIERGSPWEAIARLTGARDNALRLWAAAQGVPYPSFGITTLLDQEPPRLPDGLAATLAGTDLAELAAAARACATLLRTSAAAARDRLGVDTPESPMASWVTTLLAGAGSAPS